MWEAVGAVLSGIQTVEDMVAAFSDEQQSRRLLEAMVWPKGRICPACGYKRSIAIAGRDMGRRRARPGLYQCSSGECRFQFTATTHTPLHSTKLPLSIWLKALWLKLQSDKGLSSVRLAEAVGVSQPTAWRMGHALRLLVVRETPLGGTVEIDEFYLGGRPKPKADAPPPGRGRKGQRRTTKAPVLAVVQRPSSIAVGTPAGDARARVVDDLSAIEAERVLDEDVEFEAHLMSDEWKAFIAVGQRFAAHDTVQHSRQEYVRGQVHANSAEGFNSRVRRTIAGVFSSYQSGTCRPLFPRDRFPMVPAHCHWTGHTTHSTWPGNYQTHLVACPTCASIAMSSCKLRRAVKCAGPQKGGIFIKSSVAVFRL